MTEMLTRSAPVSLDAAARTVQAVALSGRAPAVRPAPAPDGSNTRWIEELEARGASVDTLIGAPVLKDHRNTVDSAVGSVAAARIEGDRIVTDLSFDGSPEADAALAKIAAGSVRGVSLGYIVRAWKRDGIRNGLPVFVATQWTPAELSLTPLPVDTGATFRSKNSMTDTTTETAAVDSGVVTTRADVNRTIRSIATTAGLGRDWADSRIDEGVDEDTARKLAFDEMGKRSRPLDNRAPAGSIVVGASFDDPNVMRRSMSDALAARLAPAHCKVEGPATMFRSHTPLGMLGTLLSARGEKIDAFDREGLLTRAVGAHSTSDFPLLLADAANKALSAQYQAATPTYRSIAAQKPFSDFKSAKFLRLGDFPTFKNLSEGGEPEFGTISENQETVTADEFATGIAIGRKALINDDLSALSDFSSLIAVRAGQFENGKVFGLLANDGPVLSDGKTLFHAAHGNKAASGTTIAAGVDGAVQALRAMTGLDGVKLNIQPKFLVVGPAQEANARRILASINPTTAADVNPWANAFTLIVDAEITGNRWFLVADPAQVPTLVYGWVNGAGGPKITTETDFSTQAVKVRAGLDFAAGVIDFRGVYSNVGA